MKLKTMTRKVLASLLSLAMVLTLCLPANTSTAKAATPASAGIKSYTAIGDSVATGYGPLEQDNSFSSYYFETGEGAYPRLIKDYLGISEENFHSLTAVQLMVADVFYILGGTFTDEEQARFDSKNKTYHDAEYIQIMDNLRSTKAAQGYIKNSDLITISVGNMDLMVEPVNKSIANGTLDEDLLRQKLQAGFNDYMNFMPRILGMIRAINPNARVLVLSQYFPQKKVKRPSGDAKSEEIYQTLMGINNNADTVIASTIAQNPTWNLEMVDVYGLSDYIDEIEIPTTTTEQYMAMLTPSHENHPGAEGHAWMRNRIMNQLDVDMPTTRKKADASVSYLAFSSDVHTRDSEDGLHRLEAWINGVSKANNNATFDYMGWTGDLAQYDFSGLQNNSSLTHTPVYWNKVARLMDLIEMNPNVGKGIYTTGNHDWDGGGNYRYIVNSNGNNAQRKNLFPYKNITRLGEAANTDQYAIFCMGAAHSGQEIDNDDITALDTYLKNADSDKPVFILSHYPLHTATGESKGQNLTRSTTNASKVIDVLNKYPNAVFLWGHTHTLADEHYGKVYRNTLDGIPINFTYASSGCMADGDYDGGNSGKIAAKGLVVKLNGSSKMEFTFYNKDQQKVGNTTIVEFEDTKLATAIYPEASLKDGGVYVIAATDSKTGETKALDNKHRTGYVATNSKEYTYDGLTASPTAVNSKGLTTEVPGSCYWVAEAVSGGYKFKNFVSGKYLNSSYTGGNKGDLTTDNTGDVWTYSDGSLTGKNSGKLIQYQSEYDIERDTSHPTYSGSADFWTVRTTPYESVYFYAVSTNLQNDADTTTVSGDTFKSYTEVKPTVKTKDVTTETTVYKKVAKDQLSTLADGDEIVLASGEYFVSSEDDPGYRSDNRPYKSGDGPFIYSGLEAVKAAVDPAKVSELTELVSGTATWTLHKSSSGNWNLTTDKNGETYYLAGSYVSNTEFEGENFLGIGRINLIKDINEANADAVEWQINSSSSANIKVLNPKCNKHLTYNGADEVPGDIYNNSPTAEKADVSLITVRTNPKNLYIFKKVTTQETKTIVESVDLPNGQYVIVNNADLALSNATGTGYVDNSSSQIYNGLEPTSVTVANGKITAGATDANIWNITKNSDGTYTIKDLNGKYLNGKYEDVRGTKGQPAPQDTGVRLYLDTKAFPWTLGDDFRLGFENDGIENDGKVRNISYQTNENTASVFTLRSTTSGDVLSFYKVTETSTKPKVYTYMTEGDGTVSTRKQIVEAGENVAAVTATPAAGSTFDGWYYNNTKVSPNAKYTPDKEGTYTAKFNTPAVAGSNKICTDGKAHTCTYTFKSNGQHVKKCSKCNYEVTEKCVDAKVYGKVATCKSTGLSDGAQCYFCGNKNTAQTTIAKSTSHFWSKTVAVDGAPAATCTTAGTGVHVCVVCGKQETAQVPATGHSYVEHAEKDATETEAGNKLYYTCANCDVVLDADKKATTLEKVTIPATGHSLVKHDKVAATCIAQGTEAYWECSGCGKMFSDEAGTKEITAVVPISKDLTNHVGKNVTKNAKEATCTAAGYTGDVICDACNEVITAGTTIAKKDHDYVKHDAVQATEEHGGNVEYYTCNTCDTYFDKDKKETTANDVLTGIAKHQHTLSLVAAVDGDCATAGTGAYYLCTKCNKMFSDEKATKEITSVPSTGKNPDKHVGNTEIRDALDATCTKDGNTGDTYCVSCGTRLSSGSVIPATGHSYDDGVVTTEPTCTVKGVKTFTCTVCKDTKTEDIAALGHTLTHHDAVAATETSAGNIEYYTCDTCGLYFEDADATVETSATMIIIPEAAHVHELVKADGQDPTCTEAGYKAYYTCVGCNKVFKDKEAKTELAYPETIVALGHTYKEEVTVAPTCTEFGVRTKTCTVCGDQIVEEVEATGHDYSYTSITPATKSKQGATKVICAKCGDVLSEKVIARYSTAKLSYSSTVYSGKYKKPTVKVQDANGKTIGSSNYKVTYSNNKKVGKATVKITFNGAKYKGTITKTFTIKPMKTKFTSRKALSKGMTLKWTKVSKQISGYEIQYSKNDSFSKKTSVKVSNYKTTSKKITKLSSKKKYYVRIRVYKTVDGKKYYSAWSTVKSVTTKK